MNKISVADVDSNVVDALVPPRFRIEEEEVAELQAVFVDFFTQSRLDAGGARKQIIQRFLEYPERKAGTVDPFRRRPAMFVPHVRSAVDLCRHASLNLIESIDARRIDDGMDGN